jgi:hypothetical protein
MGMGASDMDLTAFVARQCDLVSKADPFKDGPKLMETIRPFSQDIENKI